jgi:serine/threonine protein kinase
VIHRDIKPGNVFLATEEGPKGPRERVKLLDFGIARVEWAETKLTQFGAPLGTPGYMAPEQEAGDEIDPRADLFSVGAVLFECLAGHPPAPTDRLSLPSASERTSGVLPSMPPVPAPWAEFLRRAIAPNPRERFSDAKTMREALLTVARGEAEPPRSSRAQ